MTTALGARLVALLALRGGVTHALWHAGTITAAPKVSGHATARHADGSIYLYGGLTGSAGSPCTDEVWRYDTDGAWLRLEPKNAGPGRLMYAAAVCVDDVLHVIGGWHPGEPGSGGTFDDAVWRLDLQTLEWTESEHRVPGGPVSRHSACVLDDDHTGSPMVVCHTFRPGADAVLVSTDGAATFRPQPTTGAPEGLSMCASCAVGTSRMLVFGGSTREQKMSSDAYLLDAATWTWTKLESPGAGPTPRASSCAAAVGDDTVVVFGGAGIAGDGYQGGKGLCGRDETWLLRIDDNNTAHWTQLEEEAQEATPGARVAASLEPLGDGTYLLSGGWDPASKETFGDAWRLELP